MTRRNVLLDLGDIENLKRLPSGVVSGLLKRLTNPLWKSIKHLFTV